MSTLAVPGGVAVPARGLASALTHSRPTAMTMRPSLLFVLLAALLSACAGSGAAEKGPPAPEVLFYSGTADEAKSALQRVLIESRMAVATEVESPAGTWTILTEPRELSADESLKRSSFVAAMAGVTDQSHVATITARLEPVRGAAVPSTRLELRSRVDVAVGYAQTAFQRGQIERGDEVDGQHPLRARLRARLAAAGFSLAPGS